MYHSKLEPGYVGVLKSLYCVCDQYNNREIRPGKHIGVCISVANNRLFVGSIPKSKTKEQIIEEFAKVTGDMALIPSRYCANS